MTPDISPDPRREGFSHTFAGRLIALYPIRWRERYEDEFRHVLEQCPPSLYLVLDVCKGAVDAHLHYERRLRRRESLCQARSRRALFAAVLLVYLLPLTATTRPEGLFRPPLRLLP
ncbi:MAG: hypothetical protein V4671_02865 [Armatimonadota bacterium]